MHYYDSLSIPIGREIQKVKQNLNYFAKLEMPDGAPINWKFIEEKCPQQQNTSDCGPFTCLAGTYLLQGKPLTYSALDAPLMRKQILSDFIQAKVPSTAG
jgi:Ulp1 family protease